jgi:hypothetical protein
MLQIGVMPGIGTLYSVADHYEKQKLLTEIHDAGFRTSLPRLVTIVTWAAYHLGDYFCRNFERSDDNEMVPNGTTCCHDNQRNFVYCNAYLMEQSV